MIRSTQQFFSILFLTAILFFQNTVVFAGETRLFRNTDLDLDQLARSQEIAVELTHEDENYRVDASAVLAAPQEKISAVARDYDHYVDMKMPNVRMSKVVERGMDPETHRTRVFTFTDMNSKGQSSRHYTQADFIDQGLANPSALGIQWILSPRKPSWPYGEKPAFEIMDGSFYSEPLPQGGTYVRYFLNVKLQTWIPDFIVSLFVKTELKSGVVQVIRTIGREAAAR